MPEIKISIDNCDHCPFAKVSKVYTADSWDDVREIHCTKLDKKVYSYLDWYDKSPVPEYCPQKIESE